MHLNRFVWSMIVVLSAGLVAQTKQGHEPRMSGSDTLARAASLATGGTTIGDVVLSGTVRHIAGSTDEAGRAELKALATGEASIDLSLDSGPTHEVYAKGQRSPIGEWSGPDRKPHAIAYHNLLVDPAWFCPALVLQRANATPAELVTGFGNVTLSGRSVQHLRVSHKLVSGQATVRMPKDVVDTMEKATQIDLYLDPTTLLPVEMAFQLHPDNNVRQDVPIRVRYSDYRTVNGVQVPFRIQKFINNTLFLDLRLENATFNSGLAPNSFVVSDETSRRLPQ